MTESLLQNANYQQQEQTKTLSPQPEPPNLTTNNSNDTSSSHSQQTSSAQSVSQLLGILCTQAPKDELDLKTLNSPSGVEEGSSGGKAIKASDGCKRTRIGNYVLGGPLPEGSGHAYKAIDVRAIRKPVACKVLPLATYMDSLRAYFSLDGHEGVCNLIEVLVGKNHAYAFYEGHQEDLHAYMRRKRRLCESDAREIFRGILKTVNTCHELGIVVRDLKLRKFVFTDRLDRTAVKLESLDDVHILEDAADDLLNDRVGCPAYVSPEILCTCITTPYSGKAADMWSLGVLLYAMLTGRYPFYDKEHSVMFAKIRRGQFNVPDSVSYRAKNLIKALLYPNAEKRLTAEDALLHPWFDSNALGDENSSSHRSPPLWRSSNKPSSKKLLPDHVVPDFLPLFSIDDDTDIAAVS